MNETFLLYLFTRLDALNTVLFVFVFCLAFAAGMAVLAVFIEGAQFKPLAITTTAALLFFTLLAVAVPTQKDVAIIVGGSMAISAAKSPQAQEIGGLVYDAIKKQLKEAAK